MTVALCCPQCGTEYPVGTNHDAGERMKYCPECDVELYEFITPQNPDGAKSGTV